MTRESSVAASTRLAFRSYGEQPPTIAEVYDRLRDEWEQLGMLSYHGAPWSDDGKPWMADLTDEDIEKIRLLLRDTAAAIEGLA